MSFGLGPGSTPCNLPQLQFSLAGESRAQLLQAPRISPAAKAKSSQRGLSEAVVLAKQRSTPRSRPVTAPELCTARAIAGGSTAPRGPYFASMPVTGQALGGKRGCASPSRCANRSNTRSDAASADADLAPSPSTGTPVRTEQWRWRCRIDITALDLYRERIWAQRLGRHLIRTHALWLRNTPVQTLPAGPEG